MFQTQPLSLGEAMKSVRIHEYGNENVLKYEDVPLPEIQADDILIRVYAAGVNPLDWKVREGYLKGMMPHEFPLTLGWDVSGVVETVGSNVTNFQEGDAVYSLSNVIRNGAYAEYIAVNSRTVALKPKSMDHNHSAAIPLAGLTAWQALFDVANLSQGQRLLIHAAAGGVGNYQRQEELTSLAQPRHAIMHSCVSLAWMRWWIIPL